MVEHLWQRLFTCAGISQRSGREHYRLLDRHVGSMAAVMVTGTKAAPNLSCFVQVGMNTMDCYEADFEAPMLVDTAQYYKRKAAVWIEEDSCPDYMVKAEENLKMEEERVRDRQRPLPGCLSGQEAEGRQGSVLPAHAVPRYDGVHVRGREGLAA